MLHVIDRKVMKTFTTSLILASSICSGTLFALAQPSDTERVRQAIDSHCGDTWCEGDYSYNFRKVVFDNLENTTSVHFTMGFSEALKLSRDDSSSFKATLLRQSFQVSCEIRGFSGAGQVLQQQGELDRSFYRSMNDCIATLEGKLRNLLK